MNDEFKPLEVDIAADGMSIAELGEHAIELLSGNTSVDVIHGNDRVTLNTVWEPDAERAIQALIQRLKVPVSPIAMRIRYITDTSTLEPIMLLVVTVENLYMGDVLGDINKRRGFFEKLEDESDTIKRIVSKVPLAELVGYVHSLRKLSNGTATADATFDHYQPIPSPPDPPDTTAPHSAALRA